MLCIYIYVHINVSTTYAIPYSICNIYTNGAQCAMAVSCGVVDARNIFSRATILSGEVRTYLAFVVHI